MVSQCVVSVPSNQSTRDMLAGFIAFSTWEKYPKDLVNVIKHVHVMVASLGARNGSTTNRTILVADGHLQFPLVAAVEHCHGILFLSALFMHHQGIYSSNYF